MVRLFTQVKVVTLDGYGREVVGFIDTTNTNLAQVVASLDAKGEEVIEARYVR